MQGAQDKIAQLERDCLQTNDHAARAEENAAKAETEGVNLAQQLNDVKVGAQSLKNILMYYASCHIYVKPAVSVARSGLI